MSTAPSPRLTAADYLRIERASVDQKHEFYAGEMFAMAGASRQHNRLTRNLGGLLYNALAGGPCEHFLSDLRVKVDRTGLYTYPDVVVTCTEPAFEDERLDTLLNPRVVFEVLSDSTASYDRGKKFDHYRQVPTLKQYVLVAQDEAHVETFTRREDGRWLLDEAKGLEASIAVEAIGVTLALAEVYARVDLSDAGGRVGGESAEPR